MSCGTENIKVEPMDVYIGKDVAQVQKVTCVGSTASVSLNNKYFILYDAAGARYAVWIDVNNTGVAPVLGAGYTLVEVDIGVNPQTAAQVATAIQAEVDGLANFSATVSGSVVTITTVANGYCVPAHDAQSVGAKTGFAFEIVTVGDTFAKIGLIDGDIEVGGLSRSPVDITSHQTGTTILGQILTGSGNPELSFALKEVNFASYDKVLRYSNGTFVPVATGSTPVLGGGSSGLFKSPKSVQVVFHPVRLGVADKTQDYCFWNCTLDLDSITFSGENILTLPVTATAFKDCAKNPAIDVWMYGDWSQTLTA